MLSSCERREIFHVELNLWILRMIKKSKWRHLSAENEQIYEWKQNRDMYKKKTILGAEGNNQQKKNCVRWKKMLTWKYIYSSEEIW